MAHRNYYRLILGKGSAFADLCYKENFIGVDFGLHQNLSKELSDDWRDFNKKYVPIFQKLYPEKTKVGSGLACGAIWTISKGISISDIVLCPRGDGNYLVGEVSSDYFYKENSELPHRRSVKWYSNTIPRSSMSQVLRNSTGSIGTICEISRHATELLSLIAGNGPIAIFSNDETIEDPSVFAMEKHLEDFLVKNWSATDLGKKYDIFEDDGEVIGQQYPTDTGAIDILAISKDKKELLVIELKNGRASDYVVGQIQRYMGFVLEELADDHQKIRGIIIAFEDDLKIKRALSVATNIDFYKYQINFSLQKAN